MRRRGDPLPCGSTTAIGCACPQNCLTTYRMRWKSPWVGRLAYYGGGVLERGVAPGSGETPGLSRVRNGSGSCRRERVKCNIRKRKCCLCTIYLYEPPLLTVTLTPFCSLGSLKKGTFKYVDSFGKVAGHDHGQVQDLNHDH